MITHLSESDIQQIIFVEKAAFINSIQADESTIRGRLRKGHTYLGIELDKILIGTLAFRYAYFQADFEDFSRRYPDFEHFAEMENDKDANAIFVYSIGVIKEYRNAANARRLLIETLDEAASGNIQFLVGDARIPSYNGSENYPSCELFRRNNHVRKSIDNYFSTGILPSRSIIEEDPVAGFYLNVFPGGEILGITKSDFWKGDEPCGGHMIIEYLRLTI